MKKKLPTAFEGLLTKYAKKRNFFDDMRANMESMVEWK